MFTLLVRSKLSLALAFGCGLAGAADGSLPLQPGTYVVASYKPCQEAPFAGVMDFDGASFSGPHESACRTTALERHGERYRVETTCAARGDGTPAPSFAFTQDVRVKSPTDFFVLREGEDVEYALCPAFH